MPPGSATMSIRGMARPVALVLLLVADLLGDYAGDAGSTGRTVPRGIDLSLFFNQVPFASENSPTTVTGMRRSRHLHVVRRPYGPPDCQDIASEAPLAPKVREVSIALIGSINKPPRTNDSQ